MNIDITCIHGIFMSLACAHCKMAFGDERRMVEDSRAVRDKYQLRDKSAGDTKDTNPKDAIGSTKLDMGLVPDTLIVYAAMSFLEGALKYGRFNWRIAGVRASIYNAALERHRMDWWNGEDTDPVTRVHNLASIIACAGILLDAELCGKLTDDRPPRAPVAELIDHAPGLVAHLKDLFKDYNPHQYNIEDSL